MKGARLYPGWQKLRGGGLLSFGEHRWGGELPFLAGRVGAGWQSGRAGS